MLPFIRAGSALVSLASITEVDTSRIEELELSIEHDGKTSIVRGQDAIDCVMLLRPSALEGRRMRFARHAWAVHNLIGHPLMQIAAWLSLPKLGLLLHEATIPRPLTS